MYEEILRQVRYRLRPGAALYSRKLRLSCSEMNGRYSSNEFIVEVRALGGTACPFPAPLRDAVVGGWGQGLVLCLDPRGTAWEGLGCRGACGNLCLSAAQVNVLHSANRVAHPSHVLNSQQFLHRGHQPPPEMAGHSLASAHRNSSMWGSVVQ